MVGKFLTLADKGGGGSGPLNFWLTSYVNSPLPLSALDLGHKPWPTLKLKISRELAILQYCSIEILQ